MRSVAAVPYNLKPASSNCLDTDYVTHRLMSTCYHYNNTKILVKTNSSDILLSTERINPKSCDVKIRITLVKLTKRADCELPVNVTVTSFDRRHCECTRTRDSDVL